MTPAEEVDRRGMERSRAAGMTSDGGAGGLADQVTMSARPDPAGTWPGQCAPGVPAPAPAAANAIAAADRGGERDAGICRQPRGAGTGDVKSLLNFVNVASSDIKAALDKSAPCKRSVDHRKYLQKQLRHYTGSPPLHELLPLDTLGGEADETAEHGYPPADFYPDFRLDGRLLPGRADVVGSVHGWHGSGYEPVYIGPGIRPSVRVNYHHTTTAPLDLDVESGSSSHEDSGLQRDYSPISTADSQEDITPVSQKFGRLPTCSSQQQLSMAISGGGMEKDPLFEKISALSGHAAGVVDPGRGLPGLVGPASQTVPLRQRSLPASFWQEPNRPKHGLHHPDIYAYHAKHGTLPSSHAALYNELLLNSTAVSSPLGVPIFSPPHDLHKLSSSFGHGDAYFHSALAGKTPEVGGPLLGGPWPYGPGLVSRAAAEHKLHATLSHPHPAVGALGELSSLYYRPGLHPLPAGAGGAAPHTAPPSLLWEGVPQHPSDPLSLHKQQVWRPIPTKTLALSQRYHPFAGVH